MSTTVKVQIQQRIDTAANWASANPTPLSGEVCWNSDDKKYKIGDGSTAWASLAYAPGSGGYTAGTGVSISGSNVISASAVALTTVQTAANQTAHLALTTQEGDIVVRSDENKSYVRNSGTAGSMADFTLLATPTDAVLSVNGNTGAITAAHIASAVESAADSNTFTDADHTKLNAIEASATADQTGAEIKTAYEAESDTNAFTDAEKTKLSGVAASANNYTHPNHSGEVTSTADGATVIADDIVDEANLKVDNSPTNDYVLTAKSSASGGLTWAAAGGGGLWESIDSSAVSTDSNTTDLTWAHDSSITTSYDSIKLQVIKCGARVITTDAKAISNLYIRFRGRWDGSTSDTWLDTVSYRYSGTSHRTPPYAAYEDFSSSNPASTSILFGKNSGYSFSGELIVLDPFNNTSSDGPVSYQWWTTSDWDTEVEPTADSQNNSWRDICAGNIGMNMSSSSPHTWDFKLTGIRLYWAPGTHGFNTGKVNLYGLKES